MGSTPGVERHRVAPRCGLSSDLCAFKCPLARFEPSINSVWMKLPCWRNISSRPVHGILQKQSMPPNRPNYMSWRPLSSCPQVGAPTSPAVGAELPALLRTSGERVTDVIADQYRTLQCVWSLQKRRAPPGWHLTLQVRDLTLA